MRDTTEKTPGVDVDRKGGVVANVAVALQILWFICTGIEYREFKQRRKGDTKYVHPILKILSLVFAYLSVH